MLMTVFSGRRVNPWTLSHDDIDIESIAHSLSMLCRFGGHTKEFYSVAQHSVRTSQAVPPEHKLEALLHDAPEYIVQDLIRPVKRKLTEYKSLEARIWHQFAFRFGLPIVQSEVVLVADNSCLKSEIRQFLNNPGRDTELADPFWDDYQELPPVEKAWCPSEAKAHFLVAYAEALSEQIRSAPVHVTS